MRGHRPMWFLFFVMCGAAEPCEALPVQMVDEQGCREGEARMRATTHGNQTQCLQFESQQAAAEAARRFNERAKEAFRKP